MGHPASTRWLDPIAATGRSPPPPSDFRRTYNALAEAQAVDYRRYDALGEGGVPALRDYRADSPLLASAAAADRKQEPDEPDEDDEEEYEFPTVSAAAPFASSCEVSKTRLHSGGSW